MAPSGAGFLHTSSAFMKTDLSREPFELQRYISFICTFYSFQLMRDSISFNFSTKLVILVNMQYRDFHKSQPFKNFAIQKIMNKNNKYLLTLFLCIFSITMLWITYRIQIYWPEFWCFVAYCAASRDDRALLQSWVRPFEFLSSSVSQSEQLLSHVKTCRDLSKCSKICQSTQFVTEKLWNFTVN